MPAVPASASLFVDIGGSSARRRMHGVAYHASNPGVNVLEPYVRMFSVCLSLLVPLLTGW